MSYEYRVVKNPQHDYEIEAFENKINELGKHDFEFISNVGSKACVLGRIIQDDIEISNSEVEQEYTLCCGDCTHRNEEKGRCKIHGYIVHEKEPAHNCNEFHRVYKT